ncbi:MAG: LysR substrate-binding domain-containing protein [Pseudomonadota bacterium]
MSRRLPSLNQLRAFEAAARYQSIKDGADELCVTPAAVGHQIRALESFLEVSLFHRGVRQITLTEQGRQLAEDVGDALDRIEAAVAPALNNSLSGTLKISVAPFFGNRWLLPRLEQFSAQHPKIDIQPVLSFDYVDLAKEGFDAAVRYGDGTWDGTTAELVFRDTLRPVCAPQLVEGRTLPLAPDDILNLPLASAKNWPDDWIAWASATGSALAQDLAPHQYESRAFMFDSALSGQAAILADPRLTSADEKAGRLVCLTERSVQRSQGIHIVTATSEMGRKVRAFTDWMKAEAQVVQ